jgi:translation initiation factor IF-3
LGEQQLIKFAEGCAEIAAVEKPPKLEGRRMFMFLTPKASLKPPPKAKTE